MILVTGIELIEHLKLEFEAEAKGATIASDSTTGHEANRVAGYSRLISTIVSSVPAYWLVTATGLASTMIVSGFGSASDHGK